jgi:hypothetical protein
VYGGQVVRLTLIITDDALGALLLLLLLLVVSVPACFLAPSIILVTILISCSLSILKHIAQHNTAQHSAMSTASMTQNAELPGLCQALVM